MATTTLPAIEFVRKFATERGTPGAQFEFICSIEGDQRTRTARFVDATRFVKPLDLPGSDLLLK